MSRQRGCILRRLGALALAALLGGCASVTVRNGVEVQRLSLLPGLTVVNIHVASGAPVAVETRSVGLAISPTGVHLGAVAETVARLPDANECRVVVLDRPVRAPVRRQATDFCSIVPGGSL